MTQDQSAWMPDDASEGTGGARRRRAASDAGPPRFVDRFAPGDTVGADAPTGSAPHPDDDVDLTVRRAPSSTTPASSTSPAPGAPSGLTSDGPTPGVSASSSMRGPVGVPVFEAPAPGPVRISVSSPGPIEEPDRDAARGGGMLQDPISTGPQPTVPGRPAAGAVGGTPSVSPAASPVPQPSPTPQAFPSPPAPVSGVQSPVASSSSGAQAAAAAAASAPASPAAAAPAAPAPASQTAVSPAAGEASGQFAAMAASTAATGLRPRDGRKSFLSADTAVVPAETGLRGVLSRLGMRMAPSPAELSMREDVAAVSRHWPGPRTIAVANGKGGANKTPTTVMLAAVFARNGGAPVLAWDNNETRGTLGWRTEQGPHEATVLDLLPQTDALLAPSAQSALLARYVHHQTADKFDVLRSKPDVLATQQKVTSRDFDALHEVASKYFRLNVIDSGNDETAERWLRMIHHTDQLVIATTTLEEHAEAGALLLEALRARGGRYGELSERAVVVVSQSDKNGTQAQAQAIADGFGDLARRAVTIPFDIALLKGRIRFSALRPATQRAWLAAAAAVSEGL
ncbi:AAA family ATPase [Arthrobacter bussei]|uniref:AAA family ATPase n=1 Tax=Arthrobacter bussei TaxID=2594179 RepID=UPI00177DAEE7|nr:AAA family ATPase [Arthrobacter bussei]